MLDQIQLPEHPAETKQERLEQVLNLVVDRLPFQVKILAGTFLPSFRQALLSDEFEDNIDGGLERAKEVIDYVQHGTYPSE